MSDEPKGLMCINRCGRLSQMPASEYCSACTVPEDAEPLPWETINALRRTVTALREREKRLESLLREAQGHLRGWKMSMLARGREYLLEAITAALPPGDGS